MNSCTLNGMNGWIIFLLFTIVFIYLFKNSNSVGSEQSAKDILDTRYAKGEISKEEYQEKLKELDI